MTPDPFTEAASAAAEKQWTRKTSPEHPLSGPERMNRRIGFTVGAEWARDHLAAQEATEDEVEAIAREIHWHEHGGDWGDEFEDVRDEYRTRARAALSAARAARRDEEKR